MSDPDFEIVVDRSASLQKVLRATWLYPDLIAALPPAYNLLDVGLWQNPQQKTDSVRVADLYHELEASGMLAHTHSIQDLLAIQALVKARGISFYRDFFQGAKPLFWLTTHNVGDGFLEVYYLLEHFDEVIPRKLPFSLTKIDHLYVTPYFRE